MKAYIVEAPHDETLPAIRLQAENDEEQTILWCLSQLGPEQYKIAENHEGGEGKVTDIILEDASAED